MKRLIPIATGILIGSVTLIGVAQVRPAKPAPKPPVVQPADTPDTDPPICPPSNPTCGE